MTRCPRCTYRPLAHDQARCPQCALDLAPARAATPAAPNVVPFRKPPPPVVRTRTPTGGLSFSVTLDIEDLLRRVLDGLDRRRLAPLPPDER